MIGAMSVERRLASPQALLAAAQAGDTAAQTEIFERYRTRVAAQVFRMTGNAGAVDDLVQEVFIAALGGLRAFRGDAQLGTWLYRITTNKVRNWWDASRRRDARERESLALGTGPHAPDESLEVAEERRRFYRALGELSGVLREAFVLRAIEGLSLKDASEQLGVPVSTVSYRARRAEELLCDALGIPREVAP
jgi:RNA polymerase sigma-70 factor (ECF subfamily)